MSECKDCLGSVQLQQGPVGPTGATGAASTVAGPQGPQGIKGDTGPQGPGGDDGSILLYTLTASSEISVSSYTTALPTGANAWTVAANTLNTNGDTIRLETQAMTTIDDASLAGIKVQVDSQDVQIGLVSSILDFPNMERQGPFLYKLKLDVVRVSDTSLRIESHLQTCPVNIALSSYAAEHLITTGRADDFIRTSQVLTVASLTSNPFKVDVLLKTDSASRPIKLLSAKLQFLRKV